MGISGNLATMELAELLQWLSQGRKTGTLVIDNRRIEKRVFFRSGKIISAASTDPKEHLGHFLVGHGFIDEAQLAEAVRRQEKEKALLGLVLVGMEAITEEQLEETLRLKAEEGIYSLFEWPDGEFRFLEGELPTYSMVPISLDVTGLVLEGARRADELQRIRTAIPSFQAVPVAVAPDLQADPDLDERVKRILAAVNDDRTVEEIALETHTSEFAVCEALYPRIRKKQIKMVRPRLQPTAADDELSEVDALALLKRGEELVHAQTYEEALRHLTAAKSLAPESQRIRRRVEAAEQRIRTVLEEGGLYGTAVPHLDRPLEELASLSVTPREGFVLSRINGKYDLATILKISPIPPLEAMAVVWQLVRAGHVRLVRS
jgi:hypothetical protein